VALAKSCGHLSHERAVHAGPGTVGQHQSRFGIVWAIDQALDLLGHR